MVVKADVTVLLSASAAAQCMVSSPQLTGAFFTGIILRNECTSVIHCIYSNIYMFDFSATASSLNNL